MRRSESVRRLVVTGLVAAAVVYLTHVALFRRYVNDDAFITFRYSRSLAAGHGPYFNPGEHVEGYTNFLLLVLLAPAINLLGDDRVLLAAKTIGVLSGVVALSLCAATVGSLLRRRSEWGFESVLAAGFLAAAPGYAINSINGLETTLYGALLVAGIFLAHRADVVDRWRGSGVVFALAALTRPEGVLIFSAAAVARLALSLYEGPRALLQRPARRILLDGLVVALVVGAQLAFRLAWYDGEWLPNTYWAKAGGFWQRGPWSYISVGAGTPFLGIAGLALGMVGFVLDRDARTQGVPLLAAALVGLLSPFATGTDWMPGFRLMASYLPLLAAVVAIGWGFLARLLLRRPPWLAPALVLLTLPAAWLVQHSLRMDLRTTIDIRARGYATGHRALAEWLEAGAARPGDTVALMDIGIIGYVAKDLRILDTSGLTDRFIAKSPGPFLRKEFDPRYVLRQRPEFIVIVLAASPEAGLPPRRSSVSAWTPMEAAILTHPDFQREYVRLRASAPPSASWNEQLARSIGAERVFRHEYPGRRYLLAVFTRADRPAQRS